MSMRIVIGLDGSPFADSAFRVAARRARDLDATLVGVAVVDLPIVDQVDISAGAGPAFFAAETASQWVNDAKRHAEQCIARFRADCDEQGLPHEDIIHTGLASNGLLEEGKTADLIITGVRTFFSAARQQQPDDTLNDLLREPVCPVLAVPATRDLPRHVVFPYDGSTGAARALHAYVAVTPAVPRNITVELLCLARDFERLKFRLEKAQQYLRAHGIDAAVSVRDASAIDAVLAVARESAPALVILGSPMYHSLVERLFGSVTEAIIADGTIPVFIYH